MCAWGRGSRSVFQFEDAAGDVTQRPVLYIALVFNTELLRSCNLGHMAKFFAGVHISALQYALDTDAPAPRLDALLTWSIAYRRRNLMYPSQAVTTWDSFFGGFSI